MAAQVGAPGVRPFFSLPLSPLSDSLFLPSTVACFGFAAGRGCSPARRGRARGTHSHPGTKAGKLDGMRRVEERRCCDFSQSRRATWSRSVCAVFVAAPT